MRQYLHKIRQGLPVNYEAFLKKLPDEIARRHRDYFRVEKVSPQRWRVWCLEPEVMQELEALAQAPASREQAARQGDSHRHLTRMAYLLVHHEGLVDERPDVVCLSEAGTSQCYTSKPAVLVVENEDNFAAPAAMGRFASECTGQALGRANCDLVLGGGNRVTRALVVNWLAGHERVYCAFDYDLGGLKMFASLRQQLGPRAVFLQPPDWSPWQDAFRCSPGSSDRFRQAVELARKLGFEALAGVMMATGKFMEQEMILHDH